MYVNLFFFFKQKTAYEMRISDWSSDVCSSDLPFREYVYRSLMLAALYWAVTSRYGASIAQMIVTGLPNEFASIIGNSPNGVGGSFDTMWARVDVALIGMQDATKEYAEQNASMWDLQGAATAIILCLGATIIILLTRSEEHTSELQSLMRIS